MIQHQTAAPGSFGYILLGLVFFWFLLTGTPICLSDEHHTRLFRIAPDASDHEVSVSPSESLLGPFAVYFDSAGVSSVAVKVGIEGPTGLQGTAFGIRDTTGPGELVGPIAPFDVHHQMRIYEASGSSTKEYDSFAIAGEAQSGIVHFLYHLQKDACAAERHSRYRTGIWFDPSGVDPELLTKGLSVRVAIREQPFTGARVASIKPTAEGKYRGEPLLLMGSIQLGGEYVNLVMRSREGKRRERRMPVVKYVWHRGYALSLARLRGLLRGRGRATFELTNGREIYGVCFELLRRRQVVNGYPLQ